MQAVKFLLNNFDKASRDKREISTMRELGWDVTVLYPYHEKSRPCGGNYAFKNLHKFWLDKSQPSLLRKWYILCNELSAVCQVRRLDADMISCHDLGALRIAWAASLFKHKNTCMSYYLMLPNKFFENIQSETPVIGSAFPEITRLTERYQIGLLCDPDKPEEIAACIQKMRDDPVFYARCKENLKTAKQGLCWENEKRVLVNAYQSHCYRGQTS